VIKKAIAAKIKRIIRGKGMPIIYPCPIKKKLSGRPIIGHPFVIADANPLAAVRVPKVIIKGGTLSLVTNKPCVSPIREEIIKTTIIAKGTAIPLFIKRATSTPIRATNDPTERSIPPVMITRVSPTAKSPYIATCLAIVWRLKGFKKRGFIIVINKHIRIRAIKIFISRKWKPLGLFFSTDSGCMIDHFAPLLYSS